MGKLLEGMILLRLKGHMVGENGLSENQFGFRKGRSTVDAIQAVVDIATKARRGTAKRKRFWAFISIDIRNAFHTARWNICIGAMVRKKVPDYLLRMIDDYLSDSCLKMAPGKTEALLVTDRWSFQYPKIVRGEHEIEWKKSIKYLGAQLDRRFSFGQHLQIATAETVQCGAAFTRLTPNICDPREA